jgi:hypothetical protein
MITFALILIGLIYRAHLLFEALKPAMTDCGTRAVDFLAQNNATNSGDSASTVTVDTTAPVKRTACIGGKQFLIEDGSVSKVSVECEAPKSSSTPIEYVRAYLKCVHHNATVAFSFPVTFQLAMAAMLICLALLFPPHTTRLVAVLAIWIEGPGNYLTYWPYAAGYSALAILGTPLLHLLDLGTDGNDDDFGLLRNRKGQFLTRRTRGSSK